MPTPVSQYGDDSHWDAAMRDAVQHESVELLRHQFEVERGAQVSMQRNDFLVALGIVGLTLGVGAGATVLPRSSRRRSRRG